MSVRMLLNSMDSRELTEWAAYITLINEEKPEENVAEKLKKTFGHVG